jgi:DNA-binding SARP family transcriptional activator
MLLFYLAYYGDWMTREELAFFFRPDADEATGRHYVRKMLNAVRKLDWVEGLEVEPERLRWQADTDVARFRALVSEGRWERALGVYRGKFLSGLNARGLPSYEAWLELEREDLALLWQQAALGHAAELEDGARHQQAAALSRQLLQEDPLAEEALQRYMRSAYLCGQRKEALQAYGNFKSELELSLGIKPVEETCRLAELIRAAKPLSGATRPSSPRDQDEKAKPASQEERELHELVELLRDPDTRLLTFLSFGNHREALVLARRVPDVALALRAIIALAEHLIHEGHYRRALELIVLVLGHPACNLTIETELEPLWPLLEPHFPELKSVSRRCWRGPERRERWREEELNELIALASVPAS